MKIELDSSLISDILEVFLRSASHIPLERDVLRHDINNVTKQLRQALAVIPGTIGDERCTETGCSSCDQDQANWLLTIE